MEKITIECRSAEGGDDSKLLVKDMAKIYLKAASYENFSSGISEEGIGYCYI
jgi:protein subunit release factor A